LPPGYPHENFMERIFKAWRLVTDRYQRHSCHSARASLSEHVRLVAGRLGRRRRAAYHDIAGSNPGQCADRATRELANMTLLDDLRELATIELSRASAPVRSYVAYLESIAKLRHPLAVAYFVFGLAGGYCLGHLLQH
jgi:hypothetical protein